MESITYDDFTKLKIVVARILEAERIPGKSKILKGIVDIGQEKRQVIIGGAEYYTPEDLINKKVVVLTNLEPRTIGGIESSGMLLAADVENKPYWLSVSDDVPVGTMIK